LHERIVQHAKTGMENLIDYIQSDEYQQVYKQSEHKHPRERDDKDNKGKKGGATSPRKQREKEQEEEDDNKGDDDE